MIELNSRQRRFLSSRASRLKPVVLLGKEGPSPQLIGALNEALDDHELVKLKFIDHKDEKREIARSLSEESGAVLVRLIGNVAVYYRPAEKPEERRFTLP